MKRGARLQQAHRPRDLQAEADGAIAVPDTGSWPRQRRDAPEARRQPQPASYPASPAAAITRSSASPNGYAIVRQGCPSSASIRYASRRARRRGARGRPRAGVRACACATRSPNPGPAARGARPSPAGQALARAARRPSADTGHDIGSPRRPARSPRRPSRGGPAPGATAPRARAPRQAIVEGDRQRPAMRPRRRGLGEHRAAVATADQEPQLLLEALGRDGHLGRPLGADGVVAEHDDVAHPAK